MMLERGSELGMLLLLLALGPSPSSVPAAVSEGVVGPKCGVDVLIIVGIEKAAPIIGTQSIQRKRKKTRGSQIPFVNRTRFL